jgi:hypothetical protein
MSWQRTALLTAVSATTVVGQASGQENWPLELTPDPASASFVLDDAYNFASAVARLQTESDTLTVLASEYLDKATPGLREYAARYDLTAEGLRDAMREHADAYANIAETVAALEGELPRYRDAYAELQHHIPDALFSPTYFLVGTHRGIGSASVAGTLVTIETRTPTSLQGRFVALVVHEMVHMQQAMAVGPERYQAIYGPEKSLLALTLREGIAEYFTLRAIGHMTQDDAHAFVLEHQREVWARFQAEMHGSETGDWMWVAPKDPQQPRDVAYALGAVIAGAFYERADNKAQALVDILNVTDYRGFLDRSGYDPR